MASSGPWSPTSRCGNPSTLSRRLARSSCSRRSTSMTLLQANPPGRRTRRHPLRQPRSSLPHVLLLGAPTQARARAAMLAMARAARAKAARAGTLARAAHNALAVAVVAAAATSSSRSPTLEAALAPRHRSTTHGRALCSSGRVHRAVQGRRFDLRRLPSLLFLSRNSSTYSSHMCSSRTPSDLLQGSGMEDHRRHSSSNSGRPCRARPGTRLPSSTTSTP